MASTAEEVPALPIVNDVRQYEKLHRVGEGTYGVVYKVRHKETGEIKALKRVRMDRERDGIVQLEGVVTGASLDSVFLVFEYCPHDLSRLLDSVHRPFREAEVKCLMAQLLDAVAFLHDRWVIHRDLKMSNLLYTHAGTLKVCDFGLARSMQPWEEAYTQRVVTLWYRAPELLLGCEKYTEAIDVWSIGCIMAELLRHEPLFPAKTEVQALHMMCKVLGAPTAAAWPQLPSLPHASKFKLPYQPFNYLRKEIPGLSDAAHELLSQLLQYNPADRISARRALQHRWFCTEPLPPANMPTFRSTHPSATSRKRPAGVDSRELGEQRAAKRERQLHEHRRFGLAFDVGSSSRDLGRSRQAKQRLSQL